MKLILPTILTTVVSVPAFLPGYRHHYRGHQYVLNDQNESENNCYNINICSNKSDCACTNSCSNSESSLDSTTGGSVFNVGSNDSNNIRNNFNVDSNYNENEEQIGTSIWNTGAASINAPSSDTWFSDRSENVFRTGVDTRFSPEAYTRSNLGDNFNTGSDIKNVYGFRQGFGTGAGMAADSDNGFVTGAGHVHCSY